YTWQRGAPRDLVAKELRLMRSNALSKTLAFILSYSFLIANVSQGQQEPRIVLPQPPIKTETSSQKSGDAKTETSAPSGRKWDIGKTATITESIVAEKDSLMPATGGAEPMMRIALATDV